MFGSSVGQGLVASRLASLSLLDTSWLLLLRSCSLRIAASVVLRGPLGPDFPWVLRYVQSQLEASHLAHGKLPSHRTFLTEQGSHARRVPFRGAALIAASKQWGRMSLRTRHGICCLVGHQKSLLSSDGGQEGDGGHRMCFGNDYSRSDNCPHAVVFRCCTEEPNGRWA
jgi:hypothetical protein